MSYDDDRLTDILDKTDWRCHLTGQRLRFNDYNRFDRPNGWEVEHSIPRAYGGTDHLNNLFPALISANRSKGTRSSRSVRSEYGLTRSPMGSAEAERRLAAAEDHAMKVSGGAGAAFGGFVAAATAERPEDVPSRVVMGGLIGAAGGLLLSALFSGD